MVKAMGAPEWEYYAFCQGVGDSPAHSWWHRCVDLKFWMGVWQKYGLSGRICIQLLVGYKVRSKITNSPSITMPQYTLVIHSQFHSLLQDLITWNHPLLLLNQSLNCAQYSSRSLLLKNHYVSFKENIQDDKISFILIPILIKVSVRELWGQWKFCMDSKERFSIGKSFTTLSNSKKPITIDAARQDACASHIYSISYRTIPKWKGTYAKMSLLLGNRFREFGL